MSVEHRLRLLASSTDSTCVNPPISPHSLCGLSPDSADMFQGGLFHPKHPHLSPFVDDFRQAQQYPKSNVWCYPTVVEDNVQSVADLSYFTDGPCMEETGGLAPIHPGEIRKKSSDKTPMCLIADLARYNDVSGFLTFGDPETRSRVLSGPASIQADQRGRTGASEDLHCPIERGRRKQARRIRRSRRIDQESSTSGCQEGVGRNEVAKKTAEIQS